MVIDNEDKDGDGEVESWASLLDTRCEGIRNNIVIHLNRIVSRKIIQQGRIEVKQLPSER